MIGLAALTGAACAQTLPEHPRLLIRQESLAAIRERAEKTDWGKRALAGIQRSADRWLTKEIVLPDRGSQWFHWYACKKDGADLKTESPTRHVCPACGEVYTGYPYDDCVLAAVHSGFARGLLDCGLMFQLSGDSRYANKGREILLAYAAKYRSYKLHTTRGEEKIGGGRVGPQTLDEAMWLIPMAQGADLIWNALTPAERQRAAEGLFRPAAVEVILPHKMGVHNIQCWKNSAVGLVGILLGEQELITEAIDNRDRGFRVQMAKGVSPDGCWYEGAWGYHFFTMSALWPLAEAAFHCGINLYTADYKRLFEGPLRLAMPNGHLPAFNDSGEADVLGSASLYELALTRFNDPQFATVLNRSRRDSLQALVAGSLTLPAPSPAARVSRNFPGSGYAILTCGEGESATWLALKYGPHGGGHGHPVKLNFVLYARGQMIAPDPGTAKYGVALQKEWFRTTIAHNTLAVDEKSQAEATGACLGFVNGARFSAVAADAGRINPGTSFQRTFALFGDDVVLVLDRISDTQEHTFDLAYHDTKPPLEATVGQPWTAPDKPGYKYLQGVIAAANNGQVSATFQHDKDLRTRFTALLPKGWEAVVGTGIGRNAKVKQGLVLLRGKSRESLVGWAITLGATASSAPRLTLTPTANPQSKVVTLQATLGNRVCRLISNPGREPVVMAAPLDGTSPLTVAEIIDGRQFVDQAANTKF